MTTLKTALSPDETHLLIVQPVLKESQEWTDLDAKELIVSRPEILTLCKKIVERMWAIGFCIRHDVEGSYNDSALLFSTVLTLTADAKNIPVDRVTTLNINELSRALKVRMRSLIPDRQSILQLLSSCPKGLAVRYHREWLCKTIMDQFRYILEAAGVEYWHVVEQAAREYGIEQDYQKQPTRVVDFVTDYLTKCLEKMQEANSGIPAK